MTDSIRSSWLTTQYIEAMHFAQRSDILSLAPLAGTPPYKYIARFACRGLAKTGDNIAVIDHHLVGIVFPEQYQRTSCDAGQVLTWLEPKTEFHPNIKPPLCCIGPISPGMSLLSILHQLHQMITWQRFTPREDDALNQEACSWARNNLERLPVDHRRSMLIENSDQDLDSPHGEAADG